MYKTTLDALKERIKKFIVTQRVKNNDNVINVIYLPGFESQEDYEDQYLRMLWYVHPLAEYIGNVAMAIDRKTINPDARIKIPHYLDQHLLEFDNSLSGKVRLFDINDPSQWEDHLKNSHVSFGWDQEYTFKDESIARLINTYKKTMQNWRVDRKTVRFESSFYIKFSLESSPNHTHDLNASKEKFIRYITDLKRHNVNKVYIFGTGPSLDEAFKPERTFDDGISIACNSMVKNVELLDKLQPKIFVASDPIFHAGCSAYAQEFREKLFDCLDRFPKAFLVVPFRDYLIYMKNLPSRFSDRIVGIPFNHSESFNLDIMNDFQVKSTGNVMTNLLIPLASTIAGSIGMMGYDGRKIEDNEYFWAHNKKAQFNDQMDSIQIAHPSFFNIDYDDYYLEHCETLETILSQGESEGHTYANLSHSYIPALANRSQ